MQKKEKIIQTKTCKHCESNFDITDKDLEFYKKVSPKFEPSPNLSQRERDNWNNNLIPTPTLCPDCRQQRRLAFRNERNLYKRKCDATGEDIISMYSPDKKLTIYSQSFWWSDKWDAFDYGKSFDFKRGFFEQFENIYKKVPMPELLNQNNENSSYLNHSSYNKKCYLCVNTGFSEDSYYLSNYCLENKDSLDCLNIINCSHCYFCINTKDSFNSSYIFYSENIINSFYCYNCSNCKDCILCSNLNNKQYCIKNVQYSEKEYKDYIKKENLHYHREKYTSYIVEKTIYKNLNFLSSENISWNNIENSKNITYSYSLFHSQDCSYCYDWFKMKSSFDATEPYNWERQYETHACNSSTQTLFTANSYENSEIYYCYHCFNSSNLFGCIWLKNKSYCILNKQYTKEEYNILVPKIIEKMEADWEWGEFFPASLSPFGYNETVAQEYFPINSPLQRGARGGDFNWSTYTPPKPNVEKVIPASKLPEDITEIPDDILNWAIECEVTKKPFRIIPQELEFYRKHNIPVPRRHPDQRHLDRMKLRNPRKLFSRDCDKCWKEMQTTYSPEREEVVYCEECYNKEVY